MRLKRGKDYAQRGDYEQAIGRPPAALQLAHASAEAFTSRADACRLKGDYTQAAMADYGSILRLDPTSSFVLIQRGQLHWMTETLAGGDCRLHRRPCRSIPASVVALSLSRQSGLADAGDLDGGP